MAKEVSMFDSIINRIAERSESLRQLRANDTGFKTKLAAALGDAAPEDTAEAAGFVAGVESLQMQLVGAHKQTQDDANRIAEITEQRAAAYDAERAATKRADDLLAEQHLIAEKLGLLETDDDEPAGVDVEGTEETMDGVPGEGVQVDAGDPPADPVHLGGKTASEVAAEIEGQAMVNDNREAAE